jgi:LuxR family maltose regulon positive regulatory protein
MAALTLLKTKFQTPLDSPSTGGEATHRALIERPRLLQRLGAAQAGRLTLLTAPPGFGKTTLLTQWLPTCQRALAWITLDASDNDPERYLHGLLTALHLAGLPAEALLEVEARLDRFDFVNASGPEALQGLEPALAALLNTIAEHPGGLVWVLDDYHTISDPSVHALTAYLATHLPAGAHLALATRCEPPWPQARLRIRGELTEVGAALLGFTADETAQYLHAAGHARLEPCAADLAERSGGWIAAIRAALLFCEQGEAGDPSRADLLPLMHAGLSPENRYLYDYVVEEVLAWLPVEVREFLLQTGRLERLSVPICTALTGRRDTPALLSWLERAGLFLEPLNPGRTWFRLQPLFANILGAVMDAQAGGAAISAGSLSIASLTSPAARRAAVGALSLVDRRQPMTAHAAGTPALFARPDQANEPELNELSDREIEVVRLLAAGYSNQQIAAALVIAVETVKKHLKNIYSKLNVHSRTAAVAYARRVGWI